MYIFYIVKKCSINIFLHEKMSREIEGILKLIIPNTKLNANSSCHYNMTEDTLLLNVLESNIITKDQINDNFKFKLIIDTDKIPFILKDTIFSLEHIKGNLEKLYTVNTRSYEIISQFTHETFNNNFAIIIENEKYNTIFTNIITSIVILIRFKE
jgi:hypothetical protein